MSDGPESAAQEDPVLVEAARLFNDRDYYESHDVLEEEWAGARGVRRDALKALVKLAAGMYHLQTSGYQGAESLLSSGLEELDRLPPQAALVEAAPLRDPVRRCLEKIRTLKSGGAVEWSEGDLPRLRALPGESARRIRAAEAEPGQGA